MSDIGERFQADLKAEREREEADRRERARQAREASAETLQRRDLTGGLVYKEHTTAPEEVVQPATAESVPGVTAREVAVALTDLRKDIISQMNGHIDIAERNFHALENEIKRLRTKLDVQGKLANEREAQRASDHALIKVLRHEITHLREKQAKPSPTIDLVASRGASDAARS